MIQHVSVNNLNVGRNPDEVLRLLDDLRPTINRSSLDPADALGAALAPAFATESKPINDAIRGSWQRSDTDANAALTAAVLMGMNTVWYPYVEMAEGA